MTLTGAGVIAVIRLDRRLPAAAAAAIAAGGIPVLELTLTTPDALASITELRAALPECLVGAGTVLDARQARDAISAGAQFCVSPVFDPGAHAVCRDREVLYIPGAFTPTEILAAHRAGAEHIKLFPAARLGPGGLRDILAPLPFLRLVPSGGVSLANTGEWVAAGAAAVSVGTALLESADTAPSLLTSRARAFVNAVQAAR